MDQFSATAHPIDFSKPLCSKEVERILTAFGFNFYECFVSEESRVNDFFTVFPGMTPEEEAEVQANFVKAQQALGVSFTRQDLMKDVIRKLDDLQADEVQEVTV